MQYTLQDDLGMGRHFQIDRSAPGRRGIETELFGRPVTIPEGPFRLAALAGVPLIVVLARRKGHGAVEIRVGRPISLSRRASRGQLREAASQALSDVVRFVRAYPTQWFHFAGHDPTSTPERADLA